MHYHYIVRLFPEITIKSPPVRKRLTRQVRDNLRKLLHGLDREIVIQRDWEKIDVWVPENLSALLPGVEGILAHTPGVSKFFRVRTCPLEGLEALAARIEESWVPLLRDKTFRVRVRRRGSHGFTSMEAERFIGGRLMASGSPRGVDLTSPEETVALEIDKEEVHLVEAVIQGLGGFPIGSQDSVLSLISGGFDSTVASYLTMKRGLHTHFCFFNLGGRAHEFGVKEVAYYLWKKYGASHRVRFVTVPFEAVVSEILANVDNAYMGVVLKRMMYRAANAVAADLGVNALVTGESVAQVSSQTLVNLRLIDEVADMLTLRPLSVMDKGQIIDIAREIGTEDFAANMPEYCGVISVRPTTRAKRERLIAQEARFDRAVLDAAIAGRREENIDELLMDEDGAVASVEICPVPLPGATIIDIRHPDEVITRPLSAGSADLLRIPFFELNSASSRLDPDSHYMLYCDRGVMSRLHAEMLKERGFNVTVYRPPR